MPTMDEIYHKHADRYDELVRAEDHENNLGRALHELVEWDGAFVMEAGVGTGRVTRLYVDEVESAVCCDLSRHMLDYARRVLSAYKGRLTFIRARNEALPELDRPVDVFIEGWSFGHRVTECSGEEISAAVAGLVGSATKNVRPNGSVVIIETMGTNTDAPKPPRPQLVQFYEELVSHHGFAERVLRTDYRFDSNKEAARVMGFFFGADMKADVLKRGTSTIPEWTGLWTRRL